MAENSEDQEVKDAESPTSRHAEASDRPSNGRSDTDSRIEEPSNNNDVQNDDDDDERDNDDDHDDDDDDDDEEDQEEEQTEWLATTRAKRSTAGNRMSTLLAAQEAEQPDDELELLFAEADDDAAFEEDDDGSDVHMDSSSDDEDQGPTTAADDLTGEKELQQAARMEKTKERDRKKRKAQDGMAKMLKKRVRIDDAAARAAAAAAAAAAAPDETARPKKKKAERVSWLPTTDGAPTRASERGTTKAMKAHLHAQLASREAQRLKAQRKQEKLAAARKAAEKPPMTQAERMAEAARTEKRNAKSLNRWEVAEQERAEQQRAKLAALQNRTLVGPVITWWSGRGEWVGGSLKKVGKKLDVEEIKEKPKKKKMIESETESRAASTPVGDVAAEVDPSASISNSGQRNTEVHIFEPPPLAGVQPSGTPKVATISGEDDPPKTTQTAPQASSEPPALQPAHIPENLPTTSAIASTVPDPSTTSSQPAIAASTTTDDPSSVASAPIPSDPTPLTSSIPIISEPTDPLAAAPPSEFATKNYVVLQNFDDTAIRSKDTQMQILTRHSFTKVTKPKAPALCAITAYPARFRDPKTGLPYFNAHAYQQIRRLCRGEYVWSRALSAYVGGAGVAAKGVPKRFLGGGGVKEERKEVKETKEEVITGIEPVNFV